MHACVCVYEGDGFLIPLSPHNYSVSPYISILSTYSVFLFHSMFSHLYCLLSALSQACRENHVDVVKLLLDYGCNPSSPFPNSRECPLTLAAEKGYTDLTQLLLSRSACVETRTKKGCSPLYLACREGHKEIAIMLSKKGASTEVGEWEWLVGVVFLCSIT